MKLPIFRQLKYFYSVKNMLCCWNIIVLANTTDDKDSTAQGAGRR